MKPEHSERAGSFFAVLAFCGCGLGHCVHRGLRHRPLRKSASHESCRIKIANTAKPREVPSICRRRRLGRSSSRLASLCSWPDCHQRLGQHSGSNPVRCRSVGWFRDVLPQEKEETVAVKAEATVFPPLAAKSKGCRSRRICRAPCCRSKLIRSPRESKAGWPAAWPWRCSHACYGVLKQGSIWYPINLLAATAYAQSVHFGSASLNAFHLGQLPTGGGHPSDYVSAGGTALRRDAADVSAPPNSSGRPRRADSLDGIASQHPGLIESAAQPTHQLAVVHRLAVRLWHCRGIGRGAAGSACARASSCLS